MKAICVCVEDVENDDEWNFRTKVAKPKYLEGRLRRIKDKKINYNKLVFFLFVLHIHKM
jgi:hypothetical protein